jgi:ketosteroid isomerase-like protein
MSQHNVDVVQQVFGAFGRGDIPAILDLVSDDTVWGFNAQDSQVPWHATFRGKDSLPQFFGTMLENLDFRVFEPREFIASDDSVVTHVHMVYIVKKTGKKVDEEALFWWRFGPDSKIASLTHFEDTAKVEDAWRS